MESRQEREAEIKGPGETVRKPDRQNSRKKIAIAAAVFGAIVLTAGIAAAALWRGDGEETVYKETQAEYGPLTVGITESGSVTIGTTTQKLSLDISALSSPISAMPTSDGFSFMTGSLTQGGGSSSGGSSSDGRELVIEQALVSVGETVEEGDPLFSLSEESVDKLRQELVSDAEDAALTLEKTRTEQKKTKLSAAHDYETNTAYGEAAELEYNETVAELNDAYEDAVQALADADEELSKLTEELSGLQTKLSEDTRLYDEAVYLVTYIDMEDDPYGYVNALALQDSTLKTKEDREDEIEQKEEEIEEKQKNIEELDRNVTSAQAQKKSGEIKAKALYDSRVIRYQNAGELYAVETSRSELELNTAQDEYDTAKKKLDEFDACIRDYHVVSEYSGVITQVDAAEGDSLGKGSSLITLNDYDEVTITVTVDDGDIEKIQEGDEVNISLSSFPDTVYQGVVEEIGDASVNTYSSSVTYSVTVAVRGDMTGVYTGMSGEVTFITKETKDVVYITNRAVYRDGADSYVYVRDGDGNVVRKEIVTGFSDGISAEVKEGLSQGDTVLIESKVNGS